MSIRILTALAALTAAGPAFAGPDLVTTFVAPGPTYVDDVARYTVRVANNGRHNASSVSLVVDLPATNTSPTVHVLGTVTGLASGCTRSGTRVTCALGAIAKRGAKTAWIDLALPESVDPLVLVATASAAGEERPADNRASFTASPLNDDVVFAAPAALTIRHCTGTNLTSFFECELYPSSISTHASVLEANGTITIPGEPDYTGTWSRIGTTGLAMTYTLAGEPVADFVGYGVSADCFEGMTTFPDSEYVSMYEVCVD